MYVQIMNEKQICNTLTNDNTKVISITKNIYRVCLKLTFPELFFLVPFIVQIDH